MDWFTDEEEQENQDILDVEMPPSFREEAVDPVQESLAMQDEIFDAEVEMANMPESEEAVVPAIRQEIPVSAANRQEQMMNELKELQKKQRIMTGIGGLLNAGAKFGAGMSGTATGNFKASDTAGTTMKQGGDLGVQQFHERQKVEKTNTGLIDDSTLRDPSSNVSLFYRNMAKKRGFDVTDDMSAWDISQMGKMMGKPTSEGRVYQQVKVRNPETGITEVKLVNMATGQVQDGNIGAAGFAQQVRVNPRTGEVMAVDPGSGRQAGTLTGPTPQSPEQAQSKVPEITNENLTAKQQENLAKQREAFLADTKDERASLQASRSIRELLASGKALNGDIMRAVQNKFSIATGNKGATSENDVTPFGGRQAILDRINRQMNFWVNGQFTEDDRKFLSGLASIMEKSSQRELENSTKFFANNLHKDLKAAPNMQGAKITPESTTNLLGADVFSPSHGQVEVIDVRTGQRGFIPEKNLEKALASGKFKKANE